MPRPLLAILLAAFTLRLLMVPRAGIYHPDELFQYFEQAHRLLFGRGIVPWEFRLGMRSWLLPLMVTPAMKLGDLLAPGTALYLLLPRVFAAALSLTLVWSAWWLGARRSTQGAIICAIIAAGWAEFVYMAPHVLSETTSIACILPAAVLMTGERRPPRLFIAGLLFGIAVVLRPQHGPAIAVLILSDLWRHRTMRLSFAIGTGAALAICAGIDLAMQQTPFMWVVEYFRQNILHHRADQYGVASPLAYVQAIGISLGWWAFPTVLLAAVGAKREPALFRAAIVNLALHMAIGHKEFRFVLLTTAILIVLAAIGTAEGVATAQERWRGDKRLLSSMALFVWGCASLALAIAGRPALYATLDARGLALFGQLRTDAGMCGLSTYATPFTAGGGYAYLHRDVPIYGYAPAETALLAREAPAFNRMVAPAAYRPPAGFRRTSCQPGGLDYPAACIFVRPGGCRAVGSQAEINRVLMRTGE